MSETDKLTITVTAEQAMTVKSILHAVGRTFRKYKGMNTGHSEVHNLYLSDVYTCFTIADELSNKLEG